MANKENYENNVNKVGKSMREKNGKCRVYLKGELCKCRYERGYRGKGDKQWRISVKVTSDKVKIASAVNEILEKTGIDPSDTFTPKWIKDCVKGVPAGDIYINTHTAFDIPCSIKGENGVKFDLDFETELFEGATVIIALNCKKEGIYPASILVLENGKPSNPFEDFPDETEV